MTTGHGFGTLSFGTGSFGTGSFGTGVAVPSFSRVLALRENVLRLTCTEAPRYTRLLGPGDASDPRRYTVVPVEGSVGRDGEPARAVAVIATEQVAPDGLELDLWLDRPMSPEPALYRLTVQGLVVANTLLPFPTAELDYVAVFKGVPSFIPEDAINNRDIANPQSFTGLENLPVAEGQDAQRLLGRFPTDDAGDLAIDQGLVGYRKRVYRRLTTRKGNFSHIPNYGVTVLANLKQLARAGLREFLAEEAETQIRQEPETVAVSVSLVVDPNFGDVARYRVRARTRFGQQPDFNVPVSFSPTGV